MARNNEAQIKVSVFNQDFNKGMKEMGAESAKLKREFQLQQEQMKLTATETEKLSATVEYLQKQQELAAQKVAETERQYEAVKNQYGETSRAAQDMLRRLQNAQIEEQRLSNEIQITNQSLEEQQEQVDTLGDRIKDFGGKMSDVGQSLSTGITLPLVGIGAAAIKAADDVDVAGDRLQTQLGLSAEQAANLEGIAKNLWLNAFGEDMQEASDTVATIYKQLGNLPSSEIESVAESAFTLSDAFGVDIKETTRAAGQLMQQFGVDSQTAMDLLTTGFQRGGDYSDEFIDSITEYSTQFSNMGFSAEQMMGMFVSGAESGIFSLDKLGDTVKESFLQITDGGKNTREALAELGLDANQIESDLAAGGDKANTAFMAVMTAIAGVGTEADRNRLAIELMGTPLEDLGPQYQDFFASASEGMTGFKGSAKEASKTLYDNFSSDLKATKRQVQESLLPIGEILLDIVKSALPKIKEIANSFVNLSPASQTVIVAIGGILGVLGPLLMFIGSVAQGIGAIVGPIGKLIGKVRQSAGIMTFLRTALSTLTGPIGLISALVIGLGFVIYKNWDTIKAKTIEIWTAVIEWIKGAWESIKTYASETWNSIKETITGIWTGFVNFLTNTWTLIKTGMSVTWEAIKLAISTAWTAIVEAVKLIIAPFVQGIIDFFNNMKDGISTIFEGLKQFFSGAWDFIKNLFMGALLLLLDLVTGDFEKMKTDASQIFQNLSDALNNIWEGLKKIFGGALDALKGFVKTAWDHIETNSTNVFNAVKSFLTNTWETIKNKVSATIENIKNAVSSKFEALKNSISEKMNAAKTKISEIWNSIKTNSTNLPETIKNVVRDKFEALKSAVQEKMNGAKSKIEEIWNKAKSFLTDIDLTQVGKDIIQGLINGIGSKLRSLRKKAEEVANSIKGKIRGVLEINSPSRVTTEYGEFTGEGLGVGILRMKKFVENAARKLAEWATPVTNSGFTSSANEGISEAAASSMIDNRPILLTIISQLDGYEVARNQYEYINGMLGIDYGQSRRSMGIK